jgi:glutamate formiminotransferase/formiminotetrahydrofolate cyclodeaminase
MEAFALPKGTDLEKSIRNEAIQAATKKAIDVPFRVMEVAASGMELIRVMAIDGNPNSVSDAGVGALCARAAVMGAFMNVRINAKDYEDRNYVDDILSRGKLLEEKTIREEQEILAIVNEKING